ncbi:MTH1187 family thiamine-binding protein, partial [bacterium]|nr:MTH1187 family thiamine-binding protein [bacterium]
MMVQISILPISDQVSISEPLASALKIIHESGLEYRLTPMGTLLLGEWNEVMPVVKKCHDAVRENSDRVVTQIKIDDNKNTPHGFDGKVQA